MFFRLFLWYFRVATEGKWSNILGIALSHSLFTYAALSAAGEDDLTGNIVDFVYYYVVTASTVGYGDMSPVTQAGKLIVTFFVIPGGLLVFGAILAKISQGLQFEWRRIVTGAKSYADLKHTTVVIGFVHGKTPDLIKEIRACDQKATVVLCTVKDVQGEIDPSAVRYVRAQNLIDPDSLIAASVRGADRIVIHGLDDATSLSVVMAIEELNGTASISVHLDDARSEALLRRRTRATAVIDNTLHELAREVFAPGVSNVLNDLSSVRSNESAFMFQYSGVPIPAAAVKEALEQLECVYLSILLPATGERLYHLPADLMIEDAEVTYVAPKSVSLSDVLERIPLTPSLRPVEA